jgi:hypothetical protein
MTSVWGSINRVRTGDEGDVIYWAFIRAWQALAYKPPWPRRKKDMVPLILAASAELNKPGAKRYDLTSAADLAASLVTAIENTASDAKAYPGSQTQISIDQLHTWAKRIAEVYADLSAWQKNLDAAIALPSIGKPGAKDAPQRLFAAGMSKSFQELFNRPLDDVVAVLTEIVFDLRDPIGGTTIRGRRRSGGRRHIRAKK